MGDDAGMRGDVWAVWEELKQHDVSAFYELNCVMGTMQACGGTCGSNGKS